MYIGNSKKKKKNKFMLTAT